MYSEITTIAVILAVAQAHPLGQYHQATSYASFNEHKNTIQHIHSAPIAVKTAVAAVPVAHAAPVALSVAPHTAQSYSSLSFSHQPAPIAHYSAPLALAKPIVHTAPVLIKAAPVVAAHHEEEHGPAKYEFAYGVEDHHTGDIHSQKETRDGDLTKGEYSLHEADGTIRTVKYTVDKHSGFNAIVERSGHATHAQPAPAPKALIAPVLKSIVATPVYEHHY